ncbi:helix-turn-helix domain-containing protein [Gemmiger sp.]|uniref:helix-turn-helix domain-containing protein n=1 Tax=Gemmiger sp. TaxID=2049027 RepID=UPI003AF69D9F
MSRGKPNKRYTPEFKKMVVETMKKEHLSIYAAMQEFGINDHKIIERWERIYLEEGPEGLTVERRARRVSWWHGAIVSEGLQPYGVDRFTTQTGRSLSQPR